MHANTVDRAAKGVATGQGVPEDTSRLAVIDGDDAEAVLTALRCDQVALIQGLDQARADAFIASVAAEFGLLDQLALQTGFASIRGHRENVGKNFMTVNKRAGYQFIPAHSEGSQRVGMQMAAFYCHENTTDGGHSILLNANSASPAWATQREMMIKVDLGGARPSRGDVARAKVMYSIDILQEQLAPGDEIVAERTSFIPGMRVLTVLAPTSASFSTILEREVNVYWDTVASVDYDSGKEYLQLLTSSGLLKVPPEGVDIAVLDNAHERRVWSSGVKYESLFASRLTHKLAPGELVIFNNMTWSHSTSNWTPGSGVRRVVGAFA